MQKWYKEIESMFEISKYDNAETDKYVICCDHDTEISNLIEDHLDIICKEVEKLIEKQKENFNKLLQENNGFTYEFNSRFIKNNKLYWINDDNETTEITCDNEDFQYEYSLLLEAIENKNNPKVVSDIATCKYNQTVSCCSSYIIENKNIDNNNENDYNISITNEKDDYMEYNIKLDKNVLNQISNMLEIEVEEITGEDIQNVIDSSLKMSLDNF
jgi:hypothetical protein